jgi:IPT/TIG domain-containing protein
MPATYTGPYQINPKELPANQAAAALVPSAIVDSAGATWCQSPIGVGGGGMTSFVDTPISPPPGRVSCAQTSLNTEKTRQTSAQTAATNALTAINNLMATAVTAVTPATAVHAVATPVTIYGAGFTGATSATIGVATTAFTVVNDNTITCTTGAASVAGTFNVVVAGSPTGTGTLTNGFVFT